MTKQTLALLKSLRAKNEAKKPVQRYRLQGKNFSFPLTKREYENFKKGKYENYNYYRI